MNRAELRAVASAKPSFHLIQPRKVGARVVSLIPRQVMSAPSGACALRSYRESRGRSDQVGYSHSGAVETRETPDAGAAVGIPYGRRRSRHPQPANRAAVPLRTQIVRHAFGI